MLQWHQMFARRTEWSLKPNRLSAALEEARRRHGALIDLTVSNPTQCGLSFDAARLLSALAKAESLVYEPEAQGLLSARDAVCQYYTRYSHAEGVIDPGQVFITASTSEGYSFLFRLLCDPGDEVLVPRPSYPLFEYLADIQDVRLRSYELFYDHGWHIDSGGLQALVNERTRAILVVNPNNPTGSFVHSDESKELQAVCRRRGLALISDEVFLDYELESHAETSFAFTEDCLAFTLSGLSKIACLPQMKFAWIVLSGPADLQAEARARLEVIADTYLSASTPIQHAAPELLSGRGVIQQQLMRRVRSNLAALDDSLARAATSVQRLRTEGGWNAVLRVPAIQDDEDLAVRLALEKGVVVHPGHFYDFPRSGYLVLSLILPEDEFQKGIKALIDGLKS